jgi:hypothetical protein
MLRFHKFLNFGQTYTGVAPGWNRLLRYMDNNVEIPFAIIVNIDIYTPPGEQREKKMCQTRST